MQFLWVLTILYGVWLIASSLTEKGLLANGLGSGVFIELMLGTAAIGYAAYRINRRQTRGY